MWNEIFRLQLTDPSTVLKLAVRSEGVAGCTTLGAFFVTAKWLVSDPQYCDHRQGAIYCTENGFKGWVILKDRRLRRRWGKPDQMQKDPELEVEVKWVHVVGGFDAAVANATGGTAMEQLTANSEESALRIGDIRACRRMLSDFPLRVDVKRVSIREVPWPDQNLLKCFKY